MAHTWLSAMRESALAAAAYRAFRSGEEEESRQKGAEKAVASSATSGSGALSDTVRSLTGQKQGDFLSTGLQILEELSEISRK